jgi:hypothetical protein
MRISPPAKEEADLPHAEEPSLEGQSPDEKQVRFLEINTDLKDAKTQAADLVYECGEFEELCRTFERSWIHVLVLRQQRDALIKRINDAVARENYPRAEELEPQLQQSLKDARVEDNAIPTRQNHLRQNRTHLGFRLHEMHQQLVKEKEQALRARKWGEVQRLKESLELVVSTTARLMRLGRPEELRPIVCYMAVIKREVETTTGKMLFVTAYDSTRVYAMHETLNAEEKAPRFRSYSTAMQAMDSKRAKKLEEDQRLCLKCVATGSIIACTIWLL